MNVIRPHQPAGPGPGRARLVAVQEPGPDPAAGPARFAQTGTGSDVTVDRATEEATARAVAEIDRARAQLPPVDPDVFACYLGSLVRQVEADTEADPIGILASLVCAAGVHLGPGPHVRAGDDPHPLLVWPLVVGRTSAGRKGASWATAKRLLSAADAEFMTTNVRSGLTSGEGLAAMFAEPDPQPSREAGDDASDDNQPSLLDTDPPAGPDRSARRRRGRDTSPAPAGGRLPVGDRRLLVFEPEWAAVMARMRREGNSLSATLRAAWEGGDLSTMTVSARVAPESHIGLLAHITPAEFKAKVSSSDLAGGTYNRFLPVIVARTRFLPLSQGADPAVVATIGAQLRDRLERGARIGTLTFTPDGARLWERLYVEFSTDSGESGPVEQFISRAAPNCFRVAAIHAALDGTDTIGAGHLAAAAGLVRYSIASARTVFSDNPVLARLAAWITDAGPIGRTRKDIATEFFQGHGKAAETQALLDQLTASGRIARTMRAPAGGKGRPTEVFTTQPTAH